MKPRKRSLIKKGHASREKSLADENAMSCYSHSRAQGGGIASKNSISARCRIVWMLGL